MGVFEGMIMLCREFVGRSPVGKTVELELCVHNARIVRVSLSGDFFVFPESCVDSFERLLRGCCSEECIEAVFENISSSCRALGFDWDWVKNIVLNVWREAIGS